MELRRETHAVAVRVGRYGKVFDIQIALFLPQEQVS